MKKPIEIKKSGTTYDLHVMWAIHHRCNYACSYCPDDLHNGEISHLKLDELKGFIDYLYDHYVVKLNMKNLLFSFTGGEPTLWRDFRAFLDYAASKGIKLGITTNGSVNVNFWKGISEHFDYICLSYHSESADDEKFYKTFEYLHNDKSTVIPSVRFVMHHKNALWERSVNMKNRITEFPNWTYECVHILNDYGKTPVKMDYNSEEKEIFLKEHAFKSQFLDSNYVKLPEVAFNYAVNYTDGSVEKLDENKLISTGDVNFLGWECSIGLEQLLIAPTGDILSAGCPVGVKQWHGNVFKENSIKLPTKPILCTYDGGCFCPTDIRISKRKI